MDNPTWRSGCDKRVPPRSEPEKRISPEGDLRVNRQGVGICVQTGRGHLRLFVPVVFSIWQGCLSTPWLMSGEVDKESQKQGTIHENEICRVGDRLGHWVDVARTFG